MSSSHPDLTHLGNVLTNFQQTEFATLLQSIIEVKQVTRAELVRRACRHGFGWNNSIYSYFPTKKATSGRRLPTCAGFIREFSVCLELSNDEKAALLIVWSFKQAVQSQNGKYS